MIITVTQEDIAMGQRHNCIFCPIALASRRAFKNDVSVGTRFLSVGNKSFRLSKRAIDFIEAFDKYQLVEPFSFEI